jgi:hypothetical protein
MSLPRIIAVTAPSRRSGKGTISSLLVREYGYTEFAFAMGLKTTFIALCMYQGIDQKLYPRILDGDLKETPFQEIGGLSLRTYCEGVGTDWGRNMVRQTLWTDMAQQKIDKMLSLGHNLVLSDARFVNECDIARERDGEVWSVERPIENGGLAPTLASEGHLKDYPFDAMFVNSVDVPYLEGVVRLYMGAHR